MPFCQLYYHIIWSTAKREPMIRPEIEQEVYDSIARKVKALGGEAYAVNGVEDHVHLATLLPSTISISRLVGEVKGSSSFHINHLPDNHNTFDWQRGYGAITFRKEELEKVVEYIRNQKAHHGSGQINRILEHYGDD